MESNDSDGLSNHICSHSDALFPVRLQRIKQILRNGEIENGCLP